MAPGMAKAKSYPIKAGDGVEPLGGGPAEASTPYALDATLGFITVILRVDTVEIEEADPT